MSGQFVRGLDRCARVMQDLLGPRATQYLQATLGSKGTRSVREFLDRSPRHRVEVYRNKELCGSGIASWIICPDTLTSEGIVYSFGVGDNIAFDLELIERFGVHVFAFDPTPDSVAWIKSQDVPREFHLVEYGIADFDGDADFHKFDGIQFAIGPVTHSHSPTRLPVRRLNTIMTELGHSRIDLLKMNIEGGEYPAIGDVAASGIDIDQLLVQFHHWLPGYSSAQTRHAVELLGRRGFKIFNISETGREYSFIKA